MPSLWLGNSVVSLHKEQFNYFIIPLVKARQGYVALIEAVRMEVRLELIQRYSVQLLLRLGTSGLGEPFVIFSKFVSHVAY